jgi:hypothetical protein
MNTELKGIASKLLDASDLPGSDKAALAQAWDVPLCTVAVNPLWPHRYKQDAEVTADPATTPGYDTCGRTETGHAEYTPERIRSAEWGAARYQRAAENAVHKDIPMHMGIAERELIDEAHAEALAADGRISESATPVEDGDEA